MTPEIAYTVGLMASDGCLQQDRRHLNLTSVDLEQLSNFSKAMGRPLPVNKKKSGDGHFGYQIQFSDVAYYDFLLDVGLTPRKSRTIAALNIPDIYYHDFLRGLFDGDGCTYGYMDKRWRSSFMFYISFASASMEFLRFLQDTNTRLTDVSAGSIRKGKGASSLNYAKADAHKIYKYMYYNEHVLCLSRKRIKLTAFTEKDLSGILAETI